MNPHHPEPDAVPAAVSLHTLATWGAWLAWAALIGLLVAS